jgi:WD40 repeat protein
VAVGQNANKEDKREVWDITKPAKVGTITDLGVTTELNALSPDGKYFAGKTGFGTSVIGVWDIEAKKPLVDISLEDVGPPNLVAMPRGDTLVVGSGFGDVNFAIYDLPSGQPRHEINTGWSRWDAHHLAWSPGGKYLALPYRGDGDWESTVGVIDLDSGEVAGQLKLPVYATWTTIGLDIEGLAFSYDGTELAAVLNTNHTSKVVIWSVATGLITDHMTFPKKLKEIALGDRAFAQTATPLVWFPGGKRLLAFETLLLDRELATNVFELPGGELRENFPGLRRPLDDLHVTVLNVEGRDGFVVAYEIPEDKLAQAAARVAETANREPEVPVIDVVQERTTAASLAGVTWIARKDVAWSVQADPLEPGSGEARSVELVMPKGTIRQAGVSRTGSPQAVVYRSAGHDPFGRIPDGNVDPGQLKNFRWHSRPTDHTGEELASAGRSADAGWLDVYDLTSGERVRELRFGYDGDLVAVSPSAARCVIMRNETANRIDVYDLSDGTDLASWWPYQSEIEDEAKMVVSAAMPTEDVVVTLSGTGKLVAWKLPEGGGNLKALCAADNVSLPAFSPGGRYLSYSDGQAYYLVEIATGTLAGRIPDVGEVQAAAYHPDGTRLALLSSHNAGYYLFTVDLTSGIAATPFPVPVISAQMRWHGDKYLLLDHQKLVDVEQKCVAWTYVLGTGDHLPMGYGDRHWYVGTANDKPVLTAEELPDRNALSQLSSATLSPEFVLQPGESCSVTYSLNHPSLDAATRQRIESDIQSKLAANKIKVAAGRPVTLQVTATETAGESVTREYDSIGVGGSESVTFTLKTATFRVEFVSGGQTVWSWSSSTSNDSWFVSHSENESIATALERDYQNSVKSGFGGVQLPPYVFAPASANGLGTTQLTATLPR